MYSEAQIGVLKTAAWATCLIAFCLGFIIAVVAGVFLGDPRFGFTQIGVVILFLIPISFLVLPAIGFFTSKYKWRRTSIVIYWFSLGISLSFIALLVRIVFAL